MEDWWKGSFYRLQVYSGQWIILFSGEDSIDIAMRFIIIWGSLIVLKVWEIVRQGVSYLVLYKL